MAISFVNEDGEAYELLSFSLVTYTINGLVTTGQKPEVWERVRSALRERFCDGTD